MAAGARVRRSVLAALAALSLVGGGGVGCSKTGGDSSRAPARVPRDAAASPRYVAERADVAVAPASTRADFDWFNAAVQTFGSARLLPRDTAPAALAGHRALIVPAGAARDARLASACRTAIDSGLVVLVEVSGISDARAVQRWRDLAAHAPQRVVVVDADPRVDARTADLVALLEPAAPLPWLLPHPAGFAGFVLPVVIGQSGTLGALEEAIEPVIAAVDTQSSAAIAFSACIREPSVDHRDLEALRRLGAEIGVALPAGADAKRSDEDRASAAAGISQEDWRRFESTREAMRRMGAADAELAFAFAPRELVPGDYERLADAGMRLLTLPRELAGNEFPFQPADERGEPIPLVVVPCTRAFDPALDPRRLAAELRGAAAESLWVTRVETYSRFWEARARSPLTSSWDGSRLRIDVEALIDLLVVAIPRAAGGKRLVEVLKDGASVPLGLVVEGSDTRPTADVPMARGKNTIWAVYE